jgi:hypothetical protein
MSVGSVRSPACRYMPPSAKSSVGVFSQNCRILIHLVFKSIAVCQNRASLVAGGRVPDGPVRVARGGASASAGSRGPRPSAATATRHAPVTRPTSASGTFTGAQQRQVSRSAPRNDDNRMGTVYQSSPPRLLSPPGTGCSPHEPYRNEREDAEEGQERQQRRQHHESQRPALSQRKERIPLGTIGMIP